VEEDEVDVRGNVELAAARACPSAATMSGTPVEATAAAMHSSASAVMVAKTSSSGASPFQVAVGEGDHHALAQRSQPRASSSGAPASASASPRAKKGAAYAVEVLQDLRAWALATRET
jgi:hypothetical protein